MRERLKLPVAGHTYNFLKADPGPSWCGDIRDGVSFEFGKEGGWVMAFRDLERLYEAAVAARHLRCPHCGHMIGEYD